MVSSYQTGFQVLNGFAQGGLGHKQIIGGPGDGGCLFHLQSIFEVKRVHPRLPQKAQRHCVKQALECYFLPMQLYRLMGILSIDLAYDDELYILHNF